MKPTLPQWLLSVVLLPLLFACSNNSVAADSAQKPAPSPASETFATAIFAGGCFWCMEKPFDVIDGVIDTESGYTDGPLPNPTYKEVSAGTTGHTEAVKITYDPSKVTYKKLIDVFWHNIDPLAQNRQFCDGGSQYRSGVYVLNDEQRQLAEQTKAIVAQRFQQTVHTEIVAASTFWPAEEYHQNYYKKNPIRYAYYRRGCGRDKRLKQLWGDQTSLFN